jgi:hypothetical protein
LASNKITVKDNGAKALQKAIAAGAPVVDVGILGTKAGKAHGKRATVADIAGYQEFGTKHIPARPFISGWFDKHASELDELLQALAKALVEGKITREQYVKLLGNKAVGEIQKYIATNIPPPLLPATIKRKGSSVALIDTGVLRSSITFRKGEK